MPHVVVFNYETHRSGCRASRPAQSRNDSSLDLVGESEKVGTQHLIDEGDLLRVALPTVEESVCRDMDDWSEYVATIRRERGIPTQAPPSPAEIIAALDDARSGR